MNQKSAKYVSDLSTVGGKLIEASRNATDVQGFEKLFPDIRKWINEMAEDQQRVKELMQTETDPVVRNESLKQAQVWKNRNNRSPLFFNKYLATVSAAV